METRSIVKHINLLNDSQDRDIYTVAEIFLAEVEGEVKSTIWFYILIYSQFIIGMNHQ